MKHWTITKTSNLVTYG